MPDDDPIPPTLAQVQEYIIGRMVVDWRSKASTGSLPEQPPLSEGPLFLTRLRPESCARSRLPQSSRLGLQPRYKNFPRMVADVRFWGKSRHRFCPLECPV